jgi:long-subunit acyl-CoA synthetase (AMP-forming)
MFEICQKKKDSFALEDGWLSTGDIIRILKSLLIYVCYEIY